MVSLQRSANTLRNRACPCTRRGFTLIELLVVILIISALIVALAPVVKGAQDRGREQAVKTNCAAIEAALSSYAQNHAGNYPGVAQDPMSPLAGQALGDPELYDRPVGLDFPEPGQVAHALVGAEGHRNLTAAPVSQQIRNAKNTQLVSGNIAYGRYFDSLIEEGSIADYPRNVFSGFGQSQTMRNIFGFRVTPSQVDFKDVTTLNDSDVVAQSLLVPDKNSTGSGFSKSLDPITNRAWIFQDVFALPYTTYTPSAFTTACLFGPDENDYFSPGDFAYVPILSESAFGLGDDATTLRNENFLWGTQVSGYMLFGYGSGKGPKSEAIQQAQTEFASSGLPGYGAPGIDTRYEMMTLACFEGAVYYNRR
jgi:prepilin-type N-terminal cleavage/methylation domain-containing protein